MRVPLANHATFYGAQEKRKTEKQGKSHQMVVLFLGGLNFEFIQKLSRDANLLKEM